MDLKNKFKNIKKIHGGWLSINNFQLCEMTCNLKIDFLGIDLEHTTTTIEDVLQYTSLCHSKKIKCIPRIPSPDSNLIKKLLDSGVDGIIAPNIENKNQVMSILNNMKYPPNGSRGYGISKASNYGFDFDTYINEWNKRAILIIQIESIKAINNLESLLQINDIDGVMIGPYDISGSLGIPGKINHPSVKKACKEVIKLCKKYKKSCGIHDTNPNKVSLSDFYKDGYNFIILGSDIFTYWNWIEKVNKLIKKNENK